MLQCEGSVLPPCSGDVYHKIRQGARPGTVLVSNKVRDKCMETLMSYNLYWLRTMQGKKKKEEKYNLKKTMYAICVAQTRTVLQKKTLHIQ